MRILAVDLGDKRTGLAVGDDATGIASPVGKLEGAPNEQLAKAIARAVLEHEATVVVLGLPVHMDGTEGQRTKIVRAFAEHLRAALIAGASPAAVDFFDERLTSVEADWQMAQTGLTHKQKKQRRDALAAAAILRGYLAQLRDRKDQ